MLFKSATHFFKVFFFIIPLLSFSDFAFSITSKPENKVIFDDLAKAEEDFNYDNYFTITAQSAAESVSLMQFSEHNQKFPLPTEPYNRAKHFGGWIQFSGDQSCLDTRGLVLQRDSVKPVEVSPNCKVTSGQWHDDYTNKDYTSATQIQIDHVVPLKNAYMTGAYEWSDKIKCLYANYMGNNFHLKSVLGSENLRKGDRSPREYMPPNTQYTCEYLKIWMKIKYIWNLRFTPKEKDQIQNLAQQNHCTTSQLAVSQAEIDEQHRYIQENENICLKNALIAF